MTYLNLAGVALALVVSSAYSGSAQTGTDGCGESSWWRNTPEAPLSLAVSPNGRFLSIENSSVQSVRAFRFGCVSDETGELEVLCILPEERLSKCLGFGRSIFLEIAAFNEGRERCSSKRAKLAVVAVEFEDGSRWEAVRSQAVMSARSECEYAVQSGNAQSRSPE